MASAPTPTDAPEPQPIPEVVADALAGGGPVSFDDAFASALNEGNEAPAAPPAPPAPKDDAAPKGDDAPKGDEAPKDDAAPKDDVVAPPAPPAPPEPPAKPAATVDDVLAGLTKVLEQSGKPAAAPQEQQQEQPLYTEAEQGQLTEYEKNWPDVSAAETLKRRTEYHDLLKFVFTEVQKVVSPIQDTIRTMGNSLHTSELTSKVEGYSADLETQVSAWVEEQPAYLQAAYKQVMQTGTSDEVADLIGRYRAANPAPAAPTPSPAPAGKEAAPKGKEAAPTELSTAAKQAVASLAPVSGDRSQAPAGDDPGDFNSAFARYASADAG